MTVDGPSRQDEQQNLAGRIDLLRTQFQQAWNDGKSPRIEEFLQDVSAAEREAHLAELLRTELELKQQSGTAASVAEYQIRFPVDRDLLSQVFALQESADAATTADTVGLTVGMEETSSPNPHGPAADQSEHIGRFEVRALLGKGGFGSVYRAWDPQLQRDVALKVPLPGVLDSKSERARFLREARAAATLRHPNICPVFEIGEHEGGDFIVMAFIEGRTLDKMLKEGVRISQRQAVLAVRKIALGLADAHGQGVIHRDLKPANIVVDTHGEPIVMDFGLARLGTAADSSLTAQGAFMGTPAYMSPEQAEGLNDEVGPQSDIYSLGVVLYELLTGQRPYPAKRLMELVTMIVRGNPKPPSELNDAIDSQLEQICLRAMAADVEQRYLTMQDFAKELTDYLRKPAKSGEKRPSEKSIDKMVPLKEIDATSTAATDQQPTPAGPAKSPETKQPPTLEQRIEEILALRSANQPRAAADKLKELKTAASTDPELAKWCKQQQTEIKTQLKEVRKQLTSTERAARKLMDRHDFKQTVQMLEEIRPEDRTPAIDLLLSQASERNDEVEFLLLEIEQAQRTRSWDECEEKLQTLLQLKPNHQKSQQLLEQLDSLRAAKPAQRRKSNRRCDDKPWLIPAIVTSGAVACLLLIVLGIYLAGGTDPQAEFVLKIPGPQFNGATILIDGTELAQIDSSSGSLPVKIPADGREHEFQVIKRGIVLMARMLTGTSGEVQELLLEAEPEVLAQLNAAEKQTASATADGPANFALAFDGPQQYVTIPDFTQLGGGPITIETSVKLEEDSDSPFLQLDSWLTLSRSKYGGRDFFGTLTVDVGRAYLVQSGIPPQPQNTYHLALTFDNEMIKLFVNGRRIDSQLLLTDKSSGEAGLPATKIEVEKRDPLSSTFIGTRPSSGGVFHGQIDEVRISNTVRYTEDYVPLPRLQNDKHTLALYHFDEGQGDVLKDSSGNEHHGEIHGAKWVRLGDLPNPAAPGNFALEFDGRTSYATLPGFDRNLTQPLSMEVVATVQVYPSALNRFSNILVGSFGWGLALGSKGWAATLPRGTLKQPLPTASFWSETQAVLNQTVHLAYVWDPNSLNLYVDGKRQSTGVEIESPLPDPRALLNLTLGARDEGTNNQTNLFRGRIDEIRISKIARYTQDYTPQAYLEADEHTLALYHFDEGQGDVLMDSSGNGYHGKIHGAKWVRIGDRASSPTSPTTSNDPQRRAAELVLRNGGFVGVGDGKLPREVRRIEELPQGRFALHTASVADWDTLSANDLEAFGQIRSLEHLYLSSADLSNVDLKPLQRLTVLKTLWLQSADLTDRGVADIAVLKNIHNLSLKENSGISDASCDALAGLTQLRQLNLLDTSITGAGLTRLASLPHLHDIELDLSHGITAADLTQLRRFQKLESLTLWHADVSDDVIEHLSKCDQLRVIRLEGTKVSKEGVARLQRRLPNCAVVHPAAAAAVADLRLAKLAVDHGGRVKIYSSAEYFQGLPPQPFALREVFLSGVQLPLSGRTQLSGVRCLHSLHWTDLKNADRAVGLVKNLATVRTINLGSSDLSTSGCLQLKNMSQLEQLVLANCKNLSDESLPHLTEFKQLWYLNLSRTSVTDAGLRHLSPLENVQQLNLRYCPKITDEGLKSLVSWPRLNTLVLQRSNINDDSAPYLQQMSGLRKLIITETKISAAAASQIQDALPDCVVYHESLNDVPWRLPAEASSPTD